MFPDPVIVASRPLQVGSWARPLDAIMAPMARKAAVTATISLVLMGRSYPSRRRRAVSNVWQLGLERQQRRESGDGARGGALQLGAQIVARQRPSVAGPAGQRIEARQLADALARSLGVEIERLVRRARRHRQPNRVRHVEAVADKREAVALAPEPDQARGVAGELHYLEARHL